MSSIPVLPALPAGVSVAQFRTDFAEFASTAVFPDSSVNYWLTIANAKLNATVSGARWGNLLLMGIELFTAHNLVLEAMAQRGAQAQGIPGINKGAISVSNAGSVSISYDTQAAMELKAGHWNLTIYGTRFIREARMVGAGPLQIGVDAGGLAGDLSDGTGGGGWSGPPAGPGFLG